MTHIGLKPTEVGMPVEQVETPALLVDLDALERNLIRMAETVSNTSVSLRPHSKTHKCPVIANRQIALGAVGICCQKVSEAEVMVHGGVPDVLITNEIIGGSKLARLASLAKLAQIAVCADDAKNIDDLSEVAHTFGVRLPVLVELDVGEHRCGVEDAGSVLQLAKRVAASRGLRFTGIHAYHGSAQHIREYEERRRTIKNAAERVQGILGMLRQNGLAADVVTGGGTGTYPFEIESGVYTEIQPGSYIFMDADYAKVLGEDGEPLGSFEQALFVYGTVISRTVPDRAVVDVGLKAVSVDSGMPLVDGMPDVVFVAAGDEHGKLKLNNPGRSLGVGDKLRLIPGHCDPTVNLFDWYVCIRSGRVESLWPVAARGPSL